MALPTKFKALMRKKVAGIPVPILAAGAGVVGVLAYRRFAGGGGAAGGTGAGLPGDGGDGGAPSDYSGGAVGGGGSFEGGGGGGDYTVGPGGAFIPETLGVSAQAPIVKNITKIIKRQRITIGKKIVNPRRKKRNRRILVQNRIVINQAAARRKAAAKRRRGAGTGLDRGGRPINRVRGGVRTPPIIARGGFGRRGSSSSTLARRRRGQSPPIIRTGK